MSRPRIVHARNPRRIRRKAQALPAGVIVRPKHTADPATEDADLKAQEDAADRLWLELVRRTEEELARRAKEAARNVK